MTTAEQLQAFDTAALAAEVARRLAAGADPIAGGGRPTSDVAPAPAPAAKPKAKAPMKPKSVWAREKVASLRAQLEVIQAERVIGEKALQRKQQAIAVNQEQIGKFERIAKAAERKGE
jgi:hypothetical protein